MCGPPAPPAPTPTPPPPPPPEPVTHTLIISATTANPFPPSIDLNGFVSITEGADADQTTEVREGDTVVWKFAGDINAFKKIKDTSVPKKDLFSSGPSEQADGSWSGVIGDFPEGTTESYSIKYQVTGHNNPYIQDPKLRMKT